MPQQPDLALASYEQGRVSVTADAFEVPIAVAVVNAGDMTAGAFRVGVEYTSAEGGPRGVPFVVPDSPDSWYGNSRTELAPGRTVHLSGNVILPPDLEGGAADLTVVIDTCAGLEFTEEYCVVRESDEANNRVEVATITFKPDLTITAATPQVDQSVTVDGITRVPYRVTVTNQGIVPVRDPFALAVEYRTADGAAQPVPFTVPESNNTATPWIYNGLPPGTNMTLEGYLSFESKVQGLPVTVESIVDDCRLEEFSSAESYCRIDEMNESNNRSVSEFVAPRMVMPLKLEYLAPYYSEVPAANGGTLHLRLIELNEQAAPPDRRTLSLNGKDITERVIWTRETRNVWLLEMPGSLVSELSVLNELNEISAHFHYVAEQVVQSFSIPLLPFSQDTKVASKQDILALAVRQATTAHVEMLDEAITAIFASMDSGPVQAFDGTAADDNYLAHSTANEITVRDTGISHFGTDRLFIPYPWSAETIVMSQDGDNLRIDINSQNDQRRLAMYVIRNWFLRLDAESNVVDEIIFGGQTQLRAADVLRYF